MEATMQARKPLTRRGFVGGVATVLGAGYLNLRAPADLSALELGHDIRPPRLPMEDEYDSLAKLSFNENPYGPPESVMKAMTQAFKYANRYGYPDGGITDEIA